MFFLLICWSVLGLYAWIILRRWRAWLTLPPVGNSLDFAQTFLSVLIPVRNEAAHIRALLQDLEQQTYPKQNFEVLVIDDNSDDETAALVGVFKEKSKLPVRLICLQDYPGLQQKKAAITKGVALAKGELIVQTDGDCRVTPDWLFTLAQHYERTNARCISGPVCLSTDGSWFEGMQVVEFASLIGVGGASIAVGKPNMCNGANLAYAREAFLEVQGFTGNAHLASGDDEFLMHEIAKRYAGKVSFLKDKRAIVYTAAQKSVTAFFNQRIRWASKWPNYSEWSVKFLAVLVFGVNFLLFLAFMAWLGGGFGNWQVAALFSCKLSVDGIFLLAVLHFLNRKRYIIYLLPLQLVYIPYVLYTALRGLRGTYYWKGRQVTT
ncbi:glycosyltransferase [Adhaeribacter radiodurans]|uniref:Glycosyltransferase n=1 Tax=Adhaeribacter radiodurans TaxID=2745197 RepID=A0A7L7LES4_9BACT|nr:glycosyltransferase [Adhaeribacter radiodurans]QMU31348.1 glycosyltransferase [Adhaeribacter radiodurans]